MIDSYDEGEYHWNRDHYYWREVGSSLTQAWAIVRRSRSLVAIPTRSTKQD